MIKRSFLQWKRNAAEFVYKKKILMNYTEFVKCEKRKNELFSCGKKKNCANEKRKTFVILFVLVPKACSGLAVNTCVNITQASAVIAADKSF